MPKLRLSKSARKFIRKEKARIRREILDLDGQKELISELYNKFLKKPTTKKPAKKQEKQKDIK